MPISDDLPLSLEPINPDHLARPHVTALDALLGKPFPVLDKGFVRVIDYMGTDESIVQAARVSYGAGTRTIREDRGLIRYLMRHHHTTPFEMCEIKLHIRVPMDTWRQWIRHRTASVNEHSTRYSLAIEEMQQTAPDQWRLQDAGNRQGSDGYVPEDQGAMLTDREGYLQSLSRLHYEHRIEAGVAREQARKDLPLSTYTEAYWKVNLHNLLHFLELRMDAHAQEEIRAYATLIGDEIVSRWCPATWEAFRDYRLNAVSFTHPEQMVLRAMQRSDLVRGVLIVVGFIRDGKPTREAREFAAKLRELGMAVPWEET